MYGGLQMAIGTAALVGATQKKHRDSALGFFVLALSGLSLCRLGGMVAEGDDSYPPSAQNRFRQVQPGRSGYVRASQHDLRLGPLPAPPSIQEVGLETAPNPRCVRGEFHGTGHLIGQFPAEHSCKQEADPALPAIEHWRSVLRPDNKHRRFRAGDDGSLAEERDHRQRGTGAIRRITISPMTQAFVRGHFRFRSGACLYVSLPRGKERDREGTRGDQTPPPAKSSERPGRQHREPDIR